MRGNFVIRVILIGWLALGSGMAWAQAMGYRPIEPPDPDTLPPEMIVGTAERAALFRKGTATGKLRLTASTLPNKFDLRDEGYVTDTRNQGKWGTCWMFSAIGSFESCLLKMYREKADFSELNCLTNPMGAVWWSNIDLLLDGGNATMAHALLMNQFGPPLEVQDPYPSLTEQQAYADKKASAPTHPALPASRLLKEVVYLDPPYNSSTGKYNLYDEDYVRQIKELIYSYGAVTTAYYHADSNFNSARTAYYNATYSSAANHAVLLIGWDDTYAKSNFKTTPSRNGAWLVKNSWGSTYDYFYISYDDLLVNCYGGIAQFRPVNPTYCQEVSRRYQHDAGNATAYPWFYYSHYSTGSLASVFTAQSAETLYYITCINQQTEGVSIAYTLSVYGNPEANNPTSGTCLTSQQGTLTTNGQQLISLEEPVALTQGMRFSIVLSLSSSNGEAINYPYDSASKASGCTYFALSDTPSTWRDSVNKGNLSLRAITGPAATGRSGLMDWLKAAGYARESAVATATDSANAAIINYDTAVSEMSATASAQTASGLSLWDCYLAGALPDETQTLIPRLTFNDAGEPVLTPEPELAGRTYTLYSKPSLEDAWTTETDLSDKHFFKYRVSWPGDSSTP